MASVATDEDVPDLTASEAVALFFSEICVDFAGGAPTFRTVALNYRLLSRRNGWPSLSDKALSGALQKNHGCIVRNTQKRDQNGQRLSLMCFPLLERDAS